MRRVRWVHDRAKIVLAEINGPADPETGGRYTVKNNSSG